MSLANNRNKPKKIRMCPVCSKQMTGCGCQYPNTVNGVKCCSQVCVVKYEILHNLRKR